jgi:hypothetical protein
MKDEKTKDFRERSRRRKDQGGEKIKNREPERDRKRVCVVIEIYIDIV